MNNKPVVTILLFLALVGISYAQNISVSGVNAWSDKDYYDCYPSCTVLISLNNTNTGLSGGIYNVTIINTYGEGSFNYTLLSYIGPSTTHLPVSKLSDTVSKYSLFNLSTVNSLHKFYVKIDMLNPVVTKWNITLNISSYLSPVPYYELVIDPILNYSEFHWNYTYYENQSSFQTNQDINISYYFITNETANLTCSFYINNSLNNTLNSTQILTNNTVARKNINTQNTGAFWNFTWYFNCSDGNESDLYAQNSYVLVDRQGPNVTIASPTTTTDMHYNLRFNYTDYFSNITCNITTNGTLAENMTNLTNQVISSSPFSTYINVTDNGYYYTLLVCTDWLNNTRISNATFLFDNVNPSLHSVTYSTRIRGNQTEIFYNITEQNVKNVTVQYQNSSSIWNMSYNISYPEGSFNLTNITSNSLYYFQLFFFDWAGNLYSNASLFYNFSVDNTPPRVYTSLGTGESVKNQTTEKTLYYQSLIELGRYDDNLTCSYYYDGINTRNYTNVTNISANSFFDSFNISFVYGSHAWIFNCTDDLGNLNTSTGTLIFDNVSPMVNSIDFTANNTLTKQNSLEVKFNVTELSSLSYTLYDNQSNSIPGGSGSNWTSGSIVAFNFTTPDTAGNYVYYILFCDRQPTSRCTNATNINFSVDKTVPVISISVSNGTNINNPTVHENITLFISASDGFSKVHTVNVYYDYLLSDSSLILSNQTSYNITFKINVSGMHGFSVLINDSIDNKNSANITFYTQVGMINLSNFVSNIESKPMINNAEVFYNGTNVSNSAVAANSSVDIFLQTAHSTYTTINITGIEAMKTRWNKIFDVSANDNLANATVVSMGSAPIYIISVKNMSLFTSSSYNAEIIINKSVTGSQYVYYCNDLNVCQRLNFTNTTSTGYNNQTAGITKVYVPSFSSVIISNDSFVSQINISSPDTGNQTKGKLYLTLYFGEHVTGYYYVNHTLKNSTSAVLPFDTTYDGSRYVYNKLLNTSGDLLNSVGFSNGTHILYINYTDDNGNFNSTYYNVTFVYDKNQFTVDAHPFNGNEANNHDDEWENVEYYLSSPVPFSVTATVTRSWLPSSPISYSPYDYTVYYSSGLFRIYFPPSDRNQYLGIISSIGEGKSFSYSFRLFDIYGNNINKSFVYTYQSSNTTTNEEEADAGAAGTMTQTMSSSNSSQARYYNQVLSALSNASTAIESNSSASIIKLKLDSLYQKEKDLQDNYRETINYIKDLGITNLSYIGVNYADYENAIIKFKDVESRLSDLASETNLDDYFSELDTISTKQGIILFTIPEVTLLNHFVSTDTNTDDTKVETAINIANEEDTKTKISSINVTNDDGVEIKKTQDVFLIKNEETSILEMYKTKVNISITAKYDISDISVIEVIPKSMANATGELTFLTPYTKILESDPIILWELDSLDENKKYSFAYLVDRKVTSIKSTTLFDSIIGDFTSDTSENLSSLTNIDNIITGSSIENGTDGNSTKIDDSLKSRSKNFWLNVLFYAVATIVLLGGVAYVSYVILVKTKKTPQQKREVEKVKALEELRKQKDHDRQMLLYDFISKSLQDGLTIHEIKDALIKKGWPEHIINKAVEDLSFSKKAQIKMK